MAGISSHASGKMQNRDKTFQGQKFDDDLGINYDEFKWRNHDPQIGRFIEIDPLSDKYVYNSTYAFSENKITVHVELEGLEAADIKFESPHSFQFIGGDIHDKEFVKTYDYAYNRIVMPAAAGILLPNEMVGIIRLLSLSDKDNKAPSEGFRKVSDEVKQLEKSKKSFEKLIKEHNEKLDKFRQDPVTGSKQELLEGKSQEIQQKIMDGRIKALEKQIKKQEGELNKVNEKLKNKKEELKTLTN